MCSICVVKMSSCTPTKFAYLNRQLRNTQMTINEYSFFTLLQNHICTIHARYFHISINNWYMNIYAVWIPFVFVLFLKRNKHVMCTFNYINQLNILLTPIKHTKCIIICIYIYLYFNHKYKLFILLHDAAVWILVYNMKPLL